VIRGRDLDLELLDPGSEPLIRLYRHARGDWEAPPEEYRNLRVDPPRGRQDAYAVLYAANTLPAVAAECRVLNVDGMDRYTWEHRLKSTGTFGSTRRVAGRMRMRSSTRRTRCQQSLEAIEP
jgi:hypothetical protein